jgi:spore germination cell wall hydrolase CwlJ-like protein
MHDRSVLELSDTAAFPAEQRRVSPRLAWGLAGVFALLLTAAQLVSSSGFARVLEALGFSAPARAEASVRVSLEAQRAVQRLTEGNQAAIVVAGLAAQERNALIPISKAPIEQARSFLISKAAAGAGAGPFGSALTCLTQAVYYEAASEPLTGRRAVAQVVLNRMRHPAYPKSVCGVVYQGWERNTGCQFSFTCDGSLLRRGGGALWKEAQNVARAALSGYVEPSVGTATHYHADYVLPKWAFNLGKIQQIGAHIFYRFPGAWGHSSAFSGGYSGIEQIPDVNFTMLQARLDARSPAASDAGLPADIIIPQDPAGRRTSNDISSRINPLKQWRATIPDPVAASSRHTAAIEDQDVSDGPIPTSNSLASAID